jgi:hypothetical protein
VATNAAWGTLMRNASHAPRRDAWSPASRITSAAGPQGAQGAAGPIGAPAPIIEPMVEIKSGSRLRAIHRHVVGDDGSRGDVLPVATFQTQGPPLEYQPPWFDTKIGEPCTLNLAADGALRCLPRLIEYVGGGWLDDACSIPAVGTVVLGPHHELHYFGVAAPTATAGALRLDVFPVKSTESPPQLWRRSGVACVADDPSTLPVPYVVGAAALPPDSFVAFTVTRDDP